LEDQDLCLVCKAELHIGDIKLLEDEDDDFLELCPVCKVNYISEDENMCSACRTNKIKNIFVKEDDDADDSWRVILDEEVPEEEEILIPLSEIAEEEEQWDGDDEFEDEENKPVDDEDDFDFDIGDFEEDDEDEEEEDDDDDDF
jgi:hypothetical protein